MRLEALFHFSFYLTLALATACLALPATFFLAWMPYFAVGMIVLVYLAWRHERVWVLSEAAANHLGVFIAIGAAGWILFQVPRDDRDLLIGGVNWPAGLLPHLSPLLMVLLVVKLFRPKRLPDCWVIQTMGLMMVTLAAVLADEQLFGLLLVLYLTSLVWCLTLYCPIRARVLARPGVDFNHVPLFDAAVAAVPASSWPKRLAGQVKVVPWTAAIMVAGFLLFLAAPRQGQWQWNPRQLSASSAASLRAVEQASIDLNVTGRIELSEEPAFTVTVVNHDGQPQDAGAIARWRVEELEIYNAGRWYPRAPELNPRVSFKLAAVRPVPERLLAHQWLVTFQVKPNVAGGLVLAEPLDPELGIGLGPQLDGQPHARTFFAELKSGDVVVATSRGANRVHTYGQVLAFGQRGSRRAARHVEGNYEKFLANQAVPKPLVPWTRELMERSPALQALASHVDESGRLPSEHHAAVAEGLCRHLTHSGEYRYSLDLRRQRRDVDVTADFLMNVKEGHCERYAGGLALMLRTLGVRCRLVKGYLHEYAIEDGPSIVRLSQAHSWVEALVPGAEPDTWEWLTLDPTPASTTEASALASWLRWLQSQFLDVRGLWRNLIVDYTSEQQLGFAEDAFRALRTREGLLVLGGLGALLAAILLCKPAIGWARRGFQALFSGSARYGLFEEMAQLLRRRMGLVQLPTQTPREFALVAVDALQGRGVADDRARLPERIVAWHYEVRYGGQDLDSAQQAEGRRLLARLRTELGRLIS